MLSREEMSRDSSKMREASPFPLDLSIDVEFSADDDVRIGEFKRMLLACAIEMTCFRIYCGYNYYHKVARILEFVMQVSVRELKNHLSEYLHRVEEGGNIQVERRNVPVVTANLGQS